MSPRAKDRQKDPKNSNTAHLGKKTAVDRMREFPGEFYLEDDEKLLFCATCEKSVEPSRRSTVVAHIESKKHQMKKAQKLNMTSDSVTKDIKSETENEELVPMSPKSSNSHSAGKTPMDRMKEFPGVFYLEKDQKLLFCTACEKTVDPTRKSTVLGHIESKNHQKKSQNLKRALAVSVTKVEPAPAKKARKRCIISSSTVAALEVVPTVAELEVASTATSAAKDARDTVTSDFLQGLLSANIAIEKADNPQFREFLQKHVRNGGSIAGSTALRKKIPEIYKKFEENLKEVLVDCDVCIITGETTDDRGKMELHILLCSAVNSSKDILCPYLIDIVRLDKVNPCTVGGAIIRCLTLFGVSFDRVTGFVCDNARYMLSCYQDIIKPVCENAIHITCVADTLNLVGEILCKKFPDVEQFVASMTAAFCPSGRKRRVYMEFLTQAGEQKPTNPPEPIANRWYSWLLAVVHHSKYFDHYPAMIQVVQEDFGDSANVDELVELLTNEQHYKALKWKMSCISLYGQKIIKYLKFAESQSPVTHMIYNQFSDLHTMLRTASQEDWTQHLLSEGFDLEAVTALQVAMQLSLYETANKVDELIKSTDSGWCFLRAVRALDPNQVLTLSSDLEHYSAIPGLVPTPLLSAEWHTYRNVVEESHGEPCNDVLSFWRQMNKRIPQLSVIARRYLCIPVNSVDAERSFSAYKDVVSDKRHSLTDSSTKYLVGLYYNFAVMNQQKTAIDS